MSANQASMTDSEAALLDSLRKMLRQPGYLFPLAAAQRQYRDHYYGLSSAALLEDLFFDTFANYLSQYQPHLEFTRPGRGQKGWDYSFEGMEISHKVGLRPQRIAVLWDATVRETHWDCDYPIAFLCAGYQPGIGQLVRNGANRAVKPLNGKPSEQLKRGNRLWLVEWPPTGAAKVLWTAAAPSATTVGDFLPFSEIWKQVAIALDAGIPANHLEVLRSNAADKKGDSTWSPGDSVDLVFEHRAGVSLFSVADLHNVPVLNNNRALLMEVDTVAEKMEIARDKGHFVPLPLWFRVHAANRPPDLYLAQRAEYDAKFSPASQAQNAAPGIAEPDEPDEDDGALPGI